MPFVSTSQPSFRMIVVRVSELTLGKGCVIVDVIVRVSRFVISDGRRETKAPPMVRSFRR